ncbi:hypothetical protein B0H16DRAFT_1555386 [Mycena metata]|uniref:SET domain-containing protein n=1 Tax=Mycena metata TaxID=1033252 RepID=A0AAD7N665_9AGAR|nr:hypothetical protein B0H16DRAFT_1555386 [Mycena metata]
MRRGFLPNREVDSDPLYSPYPATRNKKPDRSDRLVSDTALCSTDAPPYTVKELKFWGQKNIRLADDPSMAAKVDLDQLGSSQRLVFRHIKVGTVEVSALLDCAVLNMLPTCFSDPPPALENAIEFRRTGVFANFDIRAAALLHVEIPTIVMQNTLVLNFGMTSAEVYRELMRRASAKTLPALLQLKNFQPPEMCEVEEGILRSHARGIALPAPDVPGSVAMGHSAVFLQASRLNHCCSPNVMLRFDPQSFALTVHSIRPIAKGEEIAHSYIDLTSAPTRDARRSLLRDICHFECLCDRCALPDQAAVRESDARRQRIHDRSYAEILEPFEMWLRSNGRRDLQEVIAFHLAAVEEMQVEGLYHDPYSVHVRTLAACFAVQEDLRSFRAWMGKAREAALTRLAVKTAVDMLRYIVYPETFPWWGWVQRPQSSPRG